MLELIEQLNTLGWGNVLLCFVLVVCVIVTAVSGGKKLLSTLGLRSVQSLEKEKFEHDLKQMQLQIDAIDDKVKIYQNSIISKQEEYHQQSIDTRNQLNNVQNGLKDDIHSLTEMLQQFMDEQKQSTVATLRSSLWRLHKDFVTQKYVTPDGLKTFMEMGKVYENAGGDDIYHEKLLPEVEALDIHYPSGSIYNPDEDAE